ALERDAAVLRVVRADPARRLDPRLDLRVSAAQLAAPDRARAAARVGPHVESSPARRWRPGPTAVTALGRSRAVDPARADRDDGVGGGNAGRGGTPVLGVGIVRAEDVVAADGAGGSPHAVPTSHHPG